MGDGGVEFDVYSTGENVAEVGVGDRLALRGARVMERPIELKNDIVLSYASVGYQRSEK